MFGIGVLVVGFGCCGLERGCLYDLLSSWYLVVCVAGGFAWCSVVCMIAGDACFIDVL